MTNLVGVILAAGRGSRMKQATAERPKCLTPLAGSALIDWQVGALQRAGLARVLVVRGYRGELLTGPFETVDNPRWAETNMVASLLCALPRTQGDTCIVSYSDIVYRPDHVRRLIAAEGDIAIT